MDRYARLLSTSTLQSRIIEIGAGYSPVAPKAAGWNTHVVDHADQATLRAKYGTATVNVGAIEPVDTIWRDGPLHEAVPPALRGRFDTMIASHVMEHMPDLISFLASAALLLSPGGTIAAALPDKRFCLDFFQPSSTTGDILEAHAERRTRHRLRSVWNHFAYGVTSDGKLGWGPSQKMKPKFVDPFDLAARFAAGYSDDPSQPYQDYHAWYLTPASCQLIMLELGQLGVIDWRIDQIQEAESFEFFVFLRRGVRRIENPRVLQDRRMSLLRRQVQEMQQQVSMAAAEDPTRIGQTGH